ncbi:hypothetical protein BJ741DRAFT_714320 [Chytriomyces cf. hyalinus JEL632]|nr:hypothetical protein BJ741DRAFT_714320 [Chytriomyces cf. hyalinus JEL632]
MTTKCSCCQRHELAQKQMLDEVNSLRRLLQMPPFESVCRSFLSTPGSTAPCKSIVTAPSTTALVFMPSRSTLQSMPPEVLDQIACFVSGEDILQLCHAVRYYKYISKAMFNIARHLETDDAPKAADLWPHMDIRPFGDLISKQTHLRALRTFSRILSKHGGAVAVNNLAGMEAMLGYLPVRLDVSVKNGGSLIDTDNFFSKLHDIKRIARKLSFGANYLNQCKIDRATCNMTAKWVAKLPIQVLEFLCHVRIPVQLLLQLHQAPMLESLHVTYLEDCAVVALSKCKLLRRLSIFKVFVGTESPEVLVEKVLDMVRETMIHQLELFLPFAWQKFLPSDLKDLVAALFLQHGWQEKLGLYERGETGEYFVCRKQNISEQ